jgi:hypothetical protein
MRHILILAFVLLLALFASGAAAAVAIEDGEPIALKLHMAGEPPPDCNDESSYEWVPKDSIGVTYNEATKGLDKVISKVSRMIGPCGDPGFYGHSDDGQVSLAMWGNDKTIKTMRLTIPFCVDPYRLSLGSYSDVESATKWLISCLDGAFPSYDRSENREWVNRFIKSLMNKPLRNPMLQNKIEAVDGCVLFQKQEPFVRSLTKEAEAILKCDLFGHKFTLEIAPPRSKH